MDRITATAVNRMLVWQPQPRCGCEYHNRNRGYFFNNRVYFKKFVFKKKFILPILKFELQLCHRNLLFFFLIVQKRIYGSIYFSSYLNFFNAYYCYNYHVFFRVVSRILLETSLSTKCVLLDLHIIDMMGL